MKIYYMSHFLSSYISIINSYIFYFFFNGRVTTKSFINLFVYLTKYNYKVSLSTEYKTFILNSYYLNKKGCEW